MENPNDLLEASRRIQQVVWQMKEIPELPSEAPKDVQGLSKVEFPVSGGVLTYMGNNEYPYRGFPFFEFVEKIDFVKKITRGVLSGLFHELKGHHKIWLITLLPALWFFKHLLYAAIYSFHRLVVRSRIKSIMYSEAVKELYEAFSYDDYSEDGKTRQLRDWLKDIVCMILEFDNAYRFRFQDALEGLNKDNLKKNPLRELERLLSSMQGLENGQDVKDTWHLIKLFCRIYLRLDARMKKILVRTLLRMDLSKIKLAVEDKYFCAHRKDFVPGFLKDLRSTPIENLTEEQRKDRFVIEKAHVAKSLGEEKVKFIDEFNTEKAKKVESFEAEKKKLDGELNGIRDSLKKLEGELNNEATRAAANTNGLIERTKDKPEFEFTKKALNELLEEDIKALQERYNVEAGKQNVVTQGKIESLVAVESKFKQELENLEKKYNTLLEENETAYPKRVAELKKLCLQ